MTFQELKEVLGQMTEEQLAQSVFMSLDMETNCYLTLVVSWDDAVCFIPALEGTDE